MPNESMNDILAALGLGAEQPAGMSAMLSGAPEAPDPAAEREKEIWSRIMRGPRERAKELTAEGWKDRYGITEKSGKLARIFAGLGEAGRSIATGKNYKGIADEAQERALKEYQAEVNPLQRELNVLSADKRAAAALAQRDEAMRMRNELEQEKLALNEYVKRRKLGQDDKKIQASLNLSDATMAKIKAQTDALLNTGGFSGEGAMAYFLGKHPDSPMAEAWRNLQAAKSAAQNWGKFFGPQAFGRGSGAGKGVRINERPYLYESQPGIWNTKILQSRSYTEGGGSGGATPQNPFQSEGFKQGARMFPGVAGLGAAFNAAAQGQEVQSAAAAPQPPPVLPSPDGKSQLVAQAPPKVAGQPIMPRRQKVDPALASHFRGIFGDDIDLDSEGTLPEAIRNSFWKMSKKPVAADDAEAKAITDGQRITKAGLDEAIAGTLGDTVGFFASVTTPIRQVLGINSAKSQFMIGVSTQSLNNYLRAISGLAVTKVETKRAQDILPGRNDHPRTLMQKAFQAQVMQSQDAWLKAVGLPVHQREQFFQQNPRLLTLPRDLSEVAEIYIDAAQKAKKNGAETITVFDKTLNKENTIPTKDVNKYIWDMFTDVRHDMVRAWKKTFPDGAGIGPTVKAFQKRAK